MINMLIEEKDGVFHFIIRDMSKIPEQIMFVLSLIEMFTSQHNTFINENNTIMDIEADTLHLLFRTEENARELYDFIESGYVMAKLNQDFEIDVMQNLIDRVLKIDRQK